MNRLTAKIRRSRKEN